MYDKFPTRSTNLYLCQVDIHPKSLPKLPLNLNTPNISNLYLHSFSPFTTSSPTSTRQAHPRFSHLVCTPLSFGHKRSHLPCFCRSAQLVGLPDQCDLLFSRSWQRRCSQCSENLPLLYKSFLALFGLFIVKHKCRHHCPV